MLYYVINVLTVFVCTKVGLLKVVLIAVILLPNLETILHYK